MDLPSELGGVSAVGLLSMNIRRLTLSCFALFLGLSQHLLATDAIQNAPTKPGYTVTVDVLIGENGSAEEVKLAGSDDPTGDHILDRLALDLAANVKQEPKLQDGKPVKFTARVPFNFPVDGDEGAAANNAPKPAIHAAQQPIFPENLAAKGENGGVILELQIGSFGNVQSVKVLNFSHQEYADAAVSAVKNWIFAPAQKDGVTVDCRWRIAVAFNANGKEVDWVWRAAPRPNLGGYTVVRPKLPPAPAATTPASPKLPEETSPIFKQPAAPTK